MELKKFQFFSIFILSAVFSETIISQVGNLQHRIFIQMALNKKKENSVHGIYWKEVTKQMESNNKLARRTIVFNIWKANELLWSDCI